MRVIGAYEGDYTILVSPNSGIKQENGISTEFTDVVDTIFMDHELSYTSQSVVLTSKRAFKSFCEFAGAGEPGTVVCGGIDGVDNLPARNDLMQAIMRLTTEGQVQDALGALSDGEVHGSLEGAVMDTGQMGVAAFNRRTPSSNRNSASRTATATVGNLSSRADFRSGFWITDYGSSGETDATSDTARMDTHLGGTLFGVGREVGEHWRFGVLGGYGRTKVAQPAQDASGVAQTWTVGLYGDAEAGGSRLRFGTMYNRHSFDTRRTVRFPGYSDRLSARYAAESWQFFADAGYRIGHRALTVEPFAGVSSIHLDTEGFSESGGGAALTSSSDTARRKFTTLGVRSSIEVSGSVHARAMVGRRRAIGDANPSATFALSDDPTSTEFTALGAPNAPDAVVSELGIEARLADNVFLGVGYSSQHGEGATAHGFNAALKVKF